MKPVIRIVQFLILALAAADCASKPLHYDKAAQLAKNDDYDRVIHIKELTGTETAAATAQSASPSPTPVPAPKEKSKRRKKSSKAAQAPVGASGVHQPEIEDASGFVGRRPKVDPLRVGEEVTFMMTYFGVSAGDMTLGVKPFVEVNGKKAYHTYVKLKSSDLFSMFYSVEDSAETFIDYDQWLPFSFEVNAIESKKLLAVKSVFDWQKMAAWRWERRVSQEEGEKEKRNDWKLLPFSQNVLSGFWYLRNFDLQPGKTIKFRVADDGKNIVVKAEVVRKEKIKTDLGEFDTVVVKPSVEIGGIFQPMGDVFFWLTDDDRKQFVRIEAKIKIGKIIGYLRKIKKGD